MQEFAIDVLKKNKRIVNPAYVADEWAEKMGVGGRGSRGMFGANSAAYRTLRKLHKLGLVKQHIRQYGVHTTDEYSHLSHNL